MFVHQKAGCAAPQVIPSQMPLDVFELGVQCFLAARTSRRLSFSSHASPPNHCELIALYKLLGSRSQAERENYTEDDCVRMRQKLGTNMGYEALTCMAAKEFLEIGHGSRIPGSDILILAIGG